MKRGKTPMADFVKVPASQLISAVETSVATVLSSDSTAPTRVLDLQEAHQLSHFVPVLVLVPTRAAEAKATPAKLTAPGAGNYKQSAFSNLLRKPSNQSGAILNQDGFLFGDIQVNFWSMEVKRKGELLILTALEFRILKYFVLHPRKAISRDELLNEVWGYENYPCTRTVDNHILRLRQKLENNPSRPAYFRTIHGCGYKFTP
jgi:DNA-binding winged helix-turn-helix (wHTH) protein